MNDAKREQRHLGKYYRTRRHIRDVKGERWHRQDVGVFLPQWRMRQIRWEEALMHAQAKREGKRVGDTYRFDCRCGSDECIGNIMARTLVKR